MKEAYADGHQLLHRQPGAGGHRDRAVCGPVPVPGGSSAEVAATSVPVQFLPLRAGEIFGEAVNWAVQTRQLNLDPCTYGVDGILSSKI